MAKFYAKKKGSFTAVIREDHIPLYNIIRKSGGCPPLGGSKIFVFYEENKGMFGAIFSDMQIFKDIQQKCAGTLDDLSWLIEQGDHEILYENLLDWDEFIPFLEPNPFCSEEESSYYTNLGDIRKVFFLK